MRKRPTVTPDRDWGACAEFAIGDGDSAIGISRTKQERERLRSQTLPTAGHLTPWLARRNYGILASLFWRFKESTNQEVTVTSWKAIPGVQPSYLIEDTKITENAVRSDPRWQEAMRERGVTDLSKIRIDDWAGGYFGDPKESGFRFRRAISTMAATPPPVPLLLVPWKA